MNRTTNLFILLLVILFIFPATAIRYAQAATENSQDSDSTGNEQQQNSSTGSGQESGSSNTGSGQESNNAGNEQQQSSSSTENSQQSNNAGNEQQQSNNAGNAQEMPGATSPSGPTANATSTGGPTASNSTGNMSSVDFVKGMLAVHNRERAAVGVPPLVWSDKLAADAKPWAEHVVTEGHMVHDSEHLGTLGEGESIAGYGNPWNPEVGPLTQGGGVNLWVDEKKDYHGQPMPALGSPEFNTYPGHYTQMVWRDTKEVGCATAYGRGIPYSTEVLGHVASKPNDFMSILVCRYSPPGNVIGQKPY
jgi:uncharacterized protein YkwD